MSRWYGMNVTISGFVPERIEAIKRAASEEWEFADWSDGDTGEVASYAEDHLCGGETEEEFTVRLTHAVWQANGAYCDVSVNATYLEELPYEVHALDEDDYDRWREDSEHAGETRAEEEVP
jgi:hypothetical protein